MKNCPKCGAPVNDTAKFCPVCGGACSAPEQPQQNTQEFAQQSQQQYQQASQQQTYQQPQYQAPQPSYDPYDHTAEFHNQGYFGKQGHCHALLPDGYVRRYSRAARQP